MRRRDLLGALAAVNVLPLEGRAQTASGKIARLGVLTPASSDKTPVFDAFRQELQRLGYVEGRNIALDFRLASGEHARLFAAAAALAAEPVDVIVTDGETATVVPPLLLAQAEVIE